jgi:hypothetical protein
VRFDPTTASSPYQRPSTVRVQAGGSAEPPPQPLGASSTPSPSYVPPPPLPHAGDPDTPDRAAELSDMALFDYLTINIDRWGGGNANVRTLGDHGPMLFFDNAAGFTPHATRVPLMEHRLEPVQRFRRSTIDAIRRFDIQHYRERLSHDALAPVMTDEQIQAVEARRQLLLEHVAQMEHRFGDRVYSW